MVKMKIGKVLGCRVSESIYDDFNKICDAYDVKVSNILFVSICGFLDSYKSAKNAKEFSEIIDEYVERLKIDKNKEYEAIDQKGGSI